MASFVDFWSDVDKLLSAMGEPPATFGEIREYETEWWNRREVAVEIVRARAEASIWQSAYEAAHSAT